MGENQAETRPYSLSNFFEKQHPIGGSVLVFFGEDELLDRIQLLEWADLVLPDYAPHGRLRAPVAV